MSSDEKPSSEVSSSAWRDKGVIRDRRAWAMPSLPEKLARRLLAFLDIGGRPDRVERPVQAEPRIDVAREFVGLGDDRLERGADESVAVGLAPGQRARIAAQEGKMRSEFLAKRHM